MGMALKEGWMKMREETIGCMMLLLKDDVAIPFSVSLYPKYATITDAV